jgi:hypothetical protein
VHDLLDPTTEPDQYVVVDQMAPGLAWSQPQHHYFVELRFLEDLGNGPIQASRFFSAGFTLCTSTAVLHQQTPPSYFEPGVDDAFLASVIGSSYLYSDGLEIWNTSVLLSFDTNPPGAVHGLFHPSARPPVDPGNIPDPAGAMDGPPAQAMPL